MEDNTGSRESKKKSMEDSTRSSESKEKRRKSMEDNTRSSESKGTKRKSMEDNTPTKNPSYSYSPADLWQFESPAQMAILPPRWAGSSSPHENLPCQIPALPALHEMSRLRMPMLPPRHRWAGSSSPHENLPWPSTDLLKIVPPEMVPLGMPRLPPRHRWAGSSSPHVEPDQNIVLVRAKPLGNPTAPVEADEKIIEEDAVCEACSAILREDKNILRRKCKCSGTFIHETCVARGNNCGNCRQKVRTYPVTLVRGLSSSTPMIKKAKNVWRHFHG